MFKPLSSFEWNINRSERAMQVRWLTPVLARPDGQRWFVEQMLGAEAASEAGEAEVYHLTFPFADLVTADHAKCRPDRPLSRCFVSYYSGIFGIPEDSPVWWTKTQGLLRNPVARGQNGFHEKLLAAHHPDEIVSHALRVRASANTEADVLIVADGFVIVVECKYLSPPDPSELARQREMVKRLAERRSSETRGYVGMVVGGQDVAWCHANGVPCVTWHEATVWMEEHPA